MAVMSRTSEHWLTIMTCNECGETPDYSPIYKCTLGHIVCSSCFEQLTKDGCPRCKVCNSFNFKQRRVPAEFLRKLKIKPGIGRPYRYPVENELNKTKSDRDNLSGKPSKVTMEQIFGLTEEQLKLLFKSRKKISRGEVECYQQDSKPEKENWNGSNEKSAKYEVTSEVSSPCLISKQPVSCPHETCGKMTTVSTFSQHFKYDHPEIKIISVERNKETEILHDLGVIKHGLSYCIVIIKVYEIFNMKVPTLDSKKIITVAEKLHQKIPIGTFWLMVSASGDSAQSKSFAVYWLLTNSEDTFNYQLDINSENDGTSNSVYCSTIGLLNEHNIASIISSLNCLYLTYGSLRNLLREGPAIRIKLTVY